MIIEIPDNFLDFITNMPPQKINKEKRDKKFNMELWIEKNITCVIPVMVIRKIITRAEQLGLINYDSDTGTWQGVDYCDD